MLFSVIIPTCHRNSLLKNCLERLAPYLQNLPEEMYEVIVTDDGHDSTAELFIRQDYPWVRWMQGPRRGPAANRNYGAKQAKGTWLVFTDDDCLPQQMWLASYAREIQNNPAVFVFEGKTICKDGLKSPLEYAPTNTNGGFLLSCNFCIHYSIYNKLGGFDEEFPYPHLEDNDFKDRLDQLMLPIIFVETAVVDHPARRLSSGAKLGKYQESMWYYFQYKKKQKVSVLSLIISVFRLHIYLIMKQPISLDTFKALWLIIEETLTILSHYPSWEKKYPFVKQ